MCRVGWGLALFLGLAEAGRQSVAALSSHEDVVQYFYVLFPKTEERPYIPPVLVPYMAPSPHPRALAFFLPGPLAEWVQNNNPFRDTQKTTPFDVDQYPAIPLKDLPPIPREIAHQMQKKVEQSFNGDAPRSEPASNLAPTAPQAAFEDAMPKPAAPSPVEPSARAGKRRWQDEAVDEILNDPEMSEEQIEKLLKGLLSDDERRMVMSAGVTHRVSEALALPSLTHTSTVRLLKKRRRRVRQRVINTNLEHLPYESSHAQTEAIATKPPQPLVSTQRPRRLKLRRRRKRVFKKLYEAPTMKDSASLPRASPPRERFVKFFTRHINREQLEEEQRKLETLNPNAVYDIAVPFVSRTTIAPTRHLTIRVLQNQTGPDTIASDNGAGAAVLTSRRKPKQLKESTFLYSDVASYATTESPISLTTTESRLNENGAESAEQSTQLVEATTQKMKGSAEHLYRHRARMYGITSNVADKDGAVLAPPSLASNQAAARARYRAQEQERIRLAEQMERAEELANQRLEEQRIREQREEEERLIAEENEQKRLREEEANRMAIVMEEEQRRVEEDRIAREQWERELQQKIAEETRKREEAEKATKRRKAKRRHDTVEEDEKSDEGTSDEEPSISVLPPASNAGATGFVQIPMNEYAAILQKARGSESQDQLRLQQLLSLQNRLPDGYSMVPGNTLNQQQYQGYGLYGLPYNKKKLMA
ncbi:unnamed protein product, partial [Mesorhabditis spiculigera]